MLNLYQEHFKYTKEDLSNIFGIGDTLLDTIVSAEKPKLRIA
jgi:hypothetical protein